MTATTSRLSILSKLIVVLQTIDGTGDYTEDLSLANAASTGFETPGQRTEMGLLLTARIEEGQERVEHPELNSQWENTFWELIVDLQVQGIPADGVDNIRKRLNQAIGDVNLAVARDWTLTGTVVRIAKAAVAPPEYDYDQRVGRVRMSFIANYHNVAGATI